MNRNDSKEDEITNKYKYVQDDAKSQAEIRKAIIIRCAYSNSQYKSGQPPTWVQSIHVVINMHLHFKHACELSLTGH